MFAHAGKLALEDGMSKRRDAPACKLGLEGIGSRRRAHQHGRSRLWLEEPGEPGGKADRGRELLIWETKRRICAGLWPYTPAHFWSMYSAILTRNTGGNCG